MGRARGSDTAGTATPIKSAQRSRNSSSNLAGAEDKTTTGTGPKQQTGAAVYLRLAGEQFAVTVEPEAPAGVDSLQLFSTYKAARGCAGILRLIHRLPLIDRVERGACV